MSKKFLSALTKISTAIGKKATGVFALVLVLVLAGVGVRFFVYNDTPSVDSTFLYSALSASSELTTAKLNFTGKTDYKDTGLPILSRADFIIVYKATARIGIDLKEVKVDVEEASKTIWLSIPPATVQDVKVLPSTIEYFDHSFALFNLDEKEDAVVAQALAEGDAKEEAESLGVLEYANEQAEALVIGLLSELKPEGYTFRTRK